MEAFDGRFKSKKGSSEGVFGVGVWAIKNNEVD